MDRSKGGSIGNASTYVAYNDPGEVNSVDVNRWYIYGDPRVNSATGRFLYSVDPRIPSYYLCSSDRDPELTYVLGVDRDTHPDHASHFSHGRCANGYCFGVMPGKFIVSGDGQCEDPPPPGMAPSRFYSKEMLDPNYVNSQAIVDYRKSMGLPARYQ